jgi:uncharacterized protein (DUF3084 family)
LVKGKEEAVEKREKDIPRKEVLVKGKEEAVEKLEKNVTQREVLVEGKEAAVDKREKSVTRKEDLVKEKEEAIETRDKVITRREVLINKKEHAVEERETLIRYRGGVLEQVWAFLKGNVMFVARKETSLSTSKPTNQLGRKTRNSTISSSWMVLLAGPYLQQHSHNLRS